MGSIVMSFQCDRKFLVGPSVLFGQGSFGPLLYWCFNGVTIDVSGLALVKILGLNCCGVV